MCKLRLCRVPHFDCISIVANQVLEVSCQSAPVALQPASRGVYALGYVEDDGCEAILVDVDFLVVGDLTDSAAGKKERSAKLIALISDYPGGRRGMRRFA
jgi:hypothetical protein